MSPIINGLITVIISVAVMASYNYFTTNNTPPVAVVPTDVPIGTMLPYAGKDIPAGWIACDNASYPTTTYPLLFSKIGYTYGTDDTKYRVPDTRGVFMRGMDATATRDTNRPAGSIQLSGTVPDTNSVFTGASASATGGVGYVPAPLAGQQNYYLSGGGKWQQSLTQSYIGARIIGISGSNLTFSTLNTSPVCPNPFVLTNPTTFTSPNISGNYRIDIVLNNANAAVIGTNCVIIPVIGGVSSSTTITSIPVNSVPASVSGVLILNIPANTTLAFSLTNIVFINSGGTITIVII